MSYFYEILMPKALFDDDSVPNLCHNYVSHSSTVEKFHFRCMPIHSCNSFQLHTLALSLYLALGSGTSGRRN